MVRFKLNEESPNERRLPPSVSQFQGKVNFGFLGDSTSSLVKPESRSNYPTMVKLLEDGKLFTYQSGISYKLMSGIWQVYK